MPKTTSVQIAVIGIDIGKNSFHVVGHDGSGSIILRQKWSRGQVESRLATIIMHGPYASCLALRRRCVDFQSHGHINQFGQPACLHSLHG
jgi:hypothetical protein